MDFNIIKILLVPFNKVCPPGPFLVPASLRICVFKFTHFIISVARSDNCRVNNTQILSVTLFQFISRILVEDFVVGTCDSCMFLVFHEFEIKYTSAGV